METAEGGRENHRNGTEDREDRVQRERAIGGEEGTGGIMPLGTHRSVREAQNAYGSIRR